MTKISKDSLIDLRLGAPGHATLLIDDVDMSALVHRVVFTMQAQKIGQAILHCYARNVKISGIADVVVTDETAQINPLRNIDGSFDLPPCEICGLPSDTYVADLLDTTPVGSEWQHVIPLKPRHYFCPDHNREPVIYQSG